MLRVPCPCVFPRCSDVMWHGFESFTLVTRSDGVEETKASMVMHPDLLVYTSAGGVASKLALDMFVLCIQEYKAQDVSKRKFDMCGYFPTTFVLVYFWGRIAFGFFGKV